VTLIDAFALPGAGLTWRPDERAHLGASVAAVAAAVPAGRRRDRRRVHAVPPAAAPRRRAGRAARGAGRRAPIVLADCYQSGQHYVETADGAVLAAYPEVAAYVKYEAEVTVPAIVAAGLAGAPRATHRGTRPALDALPRRRGPRSIWRPAIGSAPTSSRGSAAAGGPSRSTAARCR
jgi:hypothetical protein